MDRHEILVMLGDYNYWGGYKPKIVERPGYSKRLELLLKGKEIAVLKGVRRAGKSTIINDFIRRHTVGKERSGLIINLEDPRLPHNLNAMILQEIYDAYAEANGTEPEYVVLDEVQNVSGWEKFARLLAETKGIKTIVTGSSSALMSEEYSTVLTGRHLDLEVFPLSFKEFLEFKGLHPNDEIGQSTQKARILSHLNNYMKYGGFPAVVLAGSNARKEEMLRAYFTDITAKDIMRRYNIKKQAQLEGLARIYISNISSIQSFGSMANLLGMSLDSVERFSRYMETARLILFLSNFSYSTKAQVRSMRKAYSADTGFYFSGGFKFLENIGRVMENVVAVELFRRKTLNPSMELFYYRKDCEVDFVVKKGQKISELIQVTYASSESEIKERETRSLFKASDELRCGKLTVITFDYRGKKRTNNKSISFKPLWEWLLSDNGP